MVQPWVALTYSALSGMQVPCAALPIVPLCQQMALCFVTVRWGEQCTLAVIQNTFGWLPVGLHICPGWGGKTTEFIWCHWLFAEVADKKYVKQQNWSKLFRQFANLIFVCSSMLNHNPITQCHFQGAVWKAPRYSACMWTCIEWIYMKMQMTSRLPVL